MNTEENTMSNNQEPTDTQAKPTRGQIVWQALLASLQG